MSVKQRRYNILEDFDKVSNFLIDNYSIKKLNGYLLQPFWEYAHTNPFFNHKMTHRFGIWEDDYKVVAIVCYETDLGECFLFASERYEYLYEDMLKYAEEELSIQSQNKRKLRIWITDKQKVLFNMLVLGNYSKVDKRPITIYKYDKGFKEYILPEGYSVLSLEDEKDIKKMQHCLWKGMELSNKPEDCNMFNHSRLHFRKDLSTIIKAPNGEYACFAGMWLDSKNHYGYLKPLATSPEYRRLGLASVALMEAMKKTTYFGATYCFGGSNEFFSSMGFEVLGYREGWEKTW
ncbi:hypothetical protein GCM10023142_04500 [Anaerocolumna aminovalerica]|uniref:N-acetyltransferase domain-containing protein n=1 Tax=Anaerocolumna aminovalerica TaxID=1527 RepID=A0A1I5HS40_9FIRM|nr:GNAT family N-acetyltransferase [Anaerocolumna aminovalerica]SFO50661.1 hypothetical protein SAMN04489757_13320 [Anaerocolumna aminovalerica]